MTLKKPGQFWKKNRVFRSFLSASTISLLGSNIFDVAIPVYVAQKTGSVYALAAATVALHLPFFLMAPFTGYLVDNFNKRKILIYSDIGQVLCLVLLLIYEFFSAKALWPLLLAVFTAKTLMIFFETIATFQLIPSLVSEQDLSEANSWFLSAQRLVQIVGPMVAGIVMASVGLTSCIGLNILSFSATLYFVMKLKNLDELLGEERISGNWRKITLGDIANNFTESFQFVWKSSIFRPFVLMMFLWNFSSVGYNQPTITHYFSILKNFSADQFGLIISVFQGFGFLGLLMSGPLYKKFGFTGSFVGGTIWLSGFTSLSILFFDSPLVLASLMAVSKMGSSIFSSGTFYIRQTNVPKSRMGGVNACLRMLFMSATPISCFIQPILVETFGSLVSLIFGALCLWGTAYFAWKVGRSYSLEKAATDKIRKEGSVAA
ncbi:MAG: MFS transporter [Pseudomonadota bacterium]